MVDLESAPALTNTVGSSHRCSVRGNDVLLTHALSTTRRSVCLLRRNYNIPAMPENSDRNLLVDNPQFKRLCDFSAATISSSSTTTTSTNFPNETTSSSTSLMPKPNVISADVFRRYKNNMVAALVCMTLVGVVCGCLLIFCCK